MSEYQGTMRWFGRTFDTPMHMGMPETTLEVVGMDCLLCGEPILEGEAGITMPYVGGPDEFDGERPIHIECNLRSILGSPAHLDGTCTCHDPASPGPAGTYRKQARAVARRFSGGYFAVNDGDLRGL